MLGSMHELAPSLVNFEVSWLYNKPILRRASCGNKTKIVTSRDLVIVVEPAFDQIKTSSWELIFGGCSASHLRLELLDQAT
jgi:hypothetical protein